MNDIKWKCDNCGDRSQDYLYLMSEFGLTTPRVKNMASLRESFCKRCYLGILEEEGIPIVKEIGEINEKS